MKINTPNTPSVSQPVETAAPAKPAEAVRPDVSAEAPVEQPPQLTREEAAQQSKARDTAARAQFAQRIESGAEVAQVSPRDAVKQAQKLVDQIAANPSDAADNAIEVGRKLDQLSKDIGGMDINQALDALPDLNNLGRAVQNAQIQVHNKLESGAGDQEAGLKHIMQKLRVLDQAVNRATD